MLYIISKLQFFKLNNFLKICSLTCLLFSPVHLLTKSQNKLQLFIQDSGSNINNIYLLKNNSIITTSDEEISIKTKSHLKILQTDICQSRRLQIVTNGLVIPTTESCFLNSTYTRRSMWNWNTGIQYYLPDSQFPIRLSGLNSLGTQYTQVRDDGIIDFFSIKNNKFIKKSRVRLENINGAGRQHLRAIAMDSKLQLIALKDWRDYYVQIHDLQTGKLLHRSEFYQPKPYKTNETFIFSPDSKSYFDGKRIRYSRSGNLISSISIDPCCLLQKASFSLNGNYLALLFQNIGKGKNLSNNNYLGHKNIDTFTSKIEIYNLLDKDNVKKIQTFKSILKINAFGISFNSKQIGVILNQRQLKMFDIVN